MVLGEAPPHLLCSPVSYAIPQPLRQPERVSARLFQEIGLPQQLNNSPYFNQQVPLQPSAAEVRFASPLAQAYNYSPASTARDSSTTGSPAVVTPGFPSYTNTSTTTKPIPPTLKTSTANITKVPTRSEEQKIQAASRVNNVNIRPKTVAFGRTVNISQTVEGTSKVDRMAALKKTSSLSPPIPEESESEDKENRINEGMRRGGKEDYNGDELLKFTEVIDSLRSELDSIKQENKNLKEGQEKLTKELTELKAKDVDRVEHMLKLSTLVHDFVGRVALGEGPKPPAVREERKASNCREIVPSPARRPPLRKVESPPRAREQTERRSPRNEEDVLNENLSILQRRLQRDPIFRQHVLDVVADELDERKGKSKSPEYEKADRQRRETTPTGRARGGRSPPRRSPQRSDRRPTFTQKVTVEREYHVDPARNGLYSMDTQRFFQEHDLVSDFHDDFHDEQPADSVYQSAYQPGGSITYYPSNAGGGRRGGARYTVECPSDEVYDDFDSPARVAHDTSARKGGSARERVDRIKKERAMKQKDRSARERDDY